MEKLFSEWFFGVFEDDPLPDEIRYINFMITEYDDRYEVGFSGDENPYKKAIPGEYYPLEAQSFFCSDYYDMRPYGRDFVLSLTKKLILNIVSKTKSNDRLLLNICPNGRSYLHDMTISVGFRGENADFLVKY